MIPAHSGPVVRTVASGLLVAVAVAASMLSLTAIIVPGWWVRAGLVGIALVTAATITTRVLVERRHRARRGVGAPEAGSVLPTAAGAVVAAWFVLARFGGPTADLAVVVGPSHVGRVVSRLGEAGEIARSEVAPVAGALPIALLAVAGTLGVLLLADALAGGLRRPAAVGLPLLALWGPTLVLTGEVSWGVFVVTVTALLLLLTLEGPVGARARRSGERPPAPVRRAERSRALVTTVAAMTVAVLAGVVGTASGALPGVAGGWYRAFTTTGDTIRLAEDLDILRSLTDRSSAVVLRYEGAGDEGAQDGDTDGADGDLALGPLRSYTATAFDGRRWQRGTDRDGQEFAPSDVLWPEDPPRSVGTQEVTLTVEELRDDKLPLPIDPRTVVTDGSWRYDPTRDEVIGSRTDSGETYTLGVRARDLTPETLRDAPAADVDDAFTQVPATAHSEEIAQTARDVVGDAATGYDQAVALQRWLRDPSRFTYSTTLPRGGTGDPVWDFLQHRTGYCIQFATTMVVMARSLDLPTRMAVGYLPGDQVDETAWEITGQDSHAWPEIYFEGTGWVRFEPTPAQQTGAAPGYTVPESAGAPAPVPTANELDRGPTADPDAGEDAPVASEVPSAAPAPVDDSVPGWVWGVTAALGLGLAAVVVLIVVRRRRDTEALDPERAWSQVVGTLASRGVRLPPPTTLRRAPEAIAGEVAERSGRPVEGAVLDDLADLADAVEQSRYARDPEPVDPERLSELTSSVTKELAEQLGRPAGTRR